MYLPGRVCEFDVCVCLPGKAYYFGVCVCSREGVCAKQFASLVSVADRCRPPHGPHFQERFPASYVLNIFFFVEICDIGQVCKFKHRCHFSRRRFVAGMLPIPASLPEARFLQASASTPCLVRRVIEDFL